MKFNKLGLVAASASAVLALAGCNLIPNLADPGTTTGGGQQQQQQQPPKQQEKSDGVAGWIKDMFGSN